MWSRDSAARDRGPRSERCGDSVDRVTSPPPTSWDGRGLPPAASARIARAASDQIWVSLTSIRGQAALLGADLEAAALDPIGEVMGGIVEHIGFSGYRGCGVYYGRYGGFLTGGAAPPLGSSESGGFGGYRPYVDALYRGWETALQRMLLEAQALGADGVVGVRWRWQRLDTEGNREFTA